jgi:hypothetical protein
LANQREPGKDAARTVGRGPERRGPERRGPERRGPERRGPEQPAPGPDALALIGQVLSGSRVVTGLGSGGVRRPARARRLGAARAHGPVTGRAS